MKTKETARKEVANKNHKSILLNIVIYLIIVLIISPTILNRGIGNLDELWNYNFARNFANGLVPYRDFNMVQTPLLPMIAGTILKIFPNELLTMRILAIILHASIIFTMYKILERFLIDKKLIAGILILYFYLVKDYINIDYNYATLLVTLIMLYIEIFQNKEKLLQANKKKDLLIGLLAGVTILFKQSTGIIIAIVALFYKILYIRKKQDLIEFKNILVVRMIAMLIPLTILFIYLTFNNAVSDFIDYAIQGIRTFSNNIPYSNLIKNDDMLIKLSVIAPVILVVSYLHSLIKNEKGVNTITAYAIGMFAVAFPISDKIHFYIAFTPSIILWVCLLQQALLSIKKESKKRKQTKLDKYLTTFASTFLDLIIIVSVSLNTLIGGQAVYKYAKSARNNIELEHFKYIEMSNEQLQEIRDVDKYISLDKENEVYILDSDAAVFMIPLNRYNKDFDMFLKGNLGAKGEDGQIERIKTMDTNTKLLIKSEGRALNWQNPNKVTEYIKSNLNKIGKIQYFDIYTKAKPLAEEEEEANS